MEKTTKDMDAAPHTFAESMPVHMAESLDLLCCPGCGGYLAVDPEALLARKGKGKESKLSYAGHVLMENRHGLAVNGCVTQATGRAEPQTAVAMVEKIPGWCRVTLGRRQGS